MKNQFNKVFYLFFGSRVGGILRILESDWFRERAVFSYPLTTGMVTNYAKRRVKSQIERAKFQNMNKTKTKTKQKHRQKHDFFSFS